MRYFVGLVVVVAIATALFMGHGGSTTAPDAYSPEIGDDAHVRSAVESTVPAAADLADFEALWHAVDVKDQIGVQSLWRSGRVVGIPNNTAVHVISAAVGRWQVRILEGTYRREALWVVWDAVVR